MALQLRDVITAARDRHSAFHRTRVTDAVLARYLSDLQNEIIGRAVERDKQFMAQRATIALALDGVARPAQVGAGTGAGLPGSVAPDGTFSVAQETAGALVEALVTEAEGATIFVSERVATSADAVSLTCSTVARATNEDAGRVLVITAGTGAGQRRAILSNTATAWTISTGSDGKQWATVPDSTSLVQVVEPIYTSSLGAGVVTDLPATTSRTGYLVKLDASGTPYIDWTAPLVTSTEDGVPLPPSLAVLSGTVHYRDGDREPLTLVSHGRRFDPPRFPAAYTVGSELYLCGNRQDWCDVAALEIDYVPVAPAFTQLIDYFLLPDAARPLLVARAVAFMAQRVAGMEDVTIDPRPYLAEGARMEEHYLMTLRLSKRGRRVVIREGDY